MLGSSNEFETGIIPSAVHDIFSKRDALLQTKQVQIIVELSYLEIYLEDCFDLLTKENKENNNAEKKILNVRETNSGETYLDGLTSIPVGNIREVAQYINMANKTRSTGKTAMNNASSRSHALCIFTIHMNSPEGSSFTSKLNLVDLAGSERAKKTQCTGEAFQEGISINKGLLALGNVVSALSSKSKQQNSSGDGEKASNPSASHIHVPYRESKLTRLLKDSLGGNGFTVLLACLSPAYVNQDETINTLRFASRASSIVNKAKVNISESMKSANNSELVKEISKLRDQLFQLQGKYNNAVSSSSSNDNSSTLSEGSSESSFNYLLTSQKLNLLLKNLLMYCFSEDLPVDESDLKNIQSELSDIRNALGLDYTKPKLQQLFCADSSCLPTAELEEFNKIFGSLGSSVDLDVPDIISVIDELKHLESCLVSMNGSDKTPKCSLSARNSTVSSERSDNEILSSGTDDSFLSNISRNDINQSDHNLNISNDQTILDISSEQYPILHKADCENIEKELEENEEKLSDMVALTEQVSCVVLSVCMSNSNVLPFAFIIQFPPGLSTR
jgi:hypothetical protein